MTAEESNAQIVRQLAECWNAGNLEAMLEFYADDMEMVTDPTWPDPPVKGKEAFRRSSEEWKGSWEKAQLDVGQVHALGDRVLAEGAWDVRGAATGIGGQMPFGILFTLRDGLVVRHEWFQDQSEARRAAGLG
jgi:uncharacterized protein (TIGR02246 family)